MDSVDHTDTDTDTDMESVDHNDTDADTDTERKDSLLTDTDTRCFIWNLPIQTDTDTLYINPVSYRY